MCRATRVGVGMTRPVVGEARDLANTRLLTSISVSSPKMTLNARMAKSYRRVVSIPARANTAKAATSVTHNEARQAANRNVIPGAARLTNRNDEMSSASKIQRWQTWWIVNV